MTDPIYMTVPETAALLRVSPKTLSRWVKVDLSLPVLRIGGVVRFNRERLLRWLQTREQGLGRAKQSHKLMHSSITNGNTTGIVHDGAACA